LDDGLGGSTELLDVPFEDGLDDSAGALSDPFEVGLDGSSDSRLVPFDDEGRGIDPLLYVGSIAFAMADSSCEAVRTWFANPDVAYCLVERGCLMPAVLN
jgi:hypothetical protein